MRTYLDTANTDQQHLIHSESLTRYFTKNISIEIVNTL